MYIRTNAVFFGLLVRKKNSFRLIIRTLVTFERSLNVYRVTMKLILCTL